MQPRFDLGRQLMEGVGRSVSRVAGLSLALTVQPGLAEMIETRSVHTQESTRLVFRDAVALEGFHPRFHKLLGEPVLEQHSYARPPWVWVRKSLFGK